ncbi:MAG: DUF2889 domain-containing protein [Rhodospirillales bacterium]|nr:DUF2889 domain-containing protein [Rhodospirillales bacterium]
MPLSKPARRQHVHTRKIQCLGFHRDDGLWDIEARLTDTKTYSFGNHDRGGINAGEAIHDMLIRITINGDFVIQHAEAVTQSGPFELCPAINSAFNQLEGVKIAPGWRKSILSRFGGVKGCTHLTELMLGPISTTAFQTVRGSREGAKGPDKDTTATRIVGACHALASDGPVVQREWPDLYTGGETGGTDSGGETGDTGT